MSPNRRRLKLRYRPHQQSMETWPGNAPWKTAERGKGKKAKERERRDERICSQGVRDVADIHCWKNHPQFPNTHESTKRRNELNWNLSSVQLRCTDCTLWTEHRWPWNPKIGFSDFFCDFRLWHTFKEWTFGKITGDKPRQPAYEIEVMLSRVSWALA